VANALAQQGQQITATTSAGGLNAPLPNTPYAFSPSAGQVIGGANGAVQGAALAGKLSATTGLSSDYTTGSAAIKGADALQSQIISTLKSDPSLNSTPASLLTNLNQLLSGQISSGPQQILSKQISSYVGQLGIDPATAVNIAYQQRGTLAQLLDSLRAIAVAKNEAKNPANLNNSTSNTSTSSSSSNPTWDDVAKIK
jgi:hypothetical protein